MYHNYFGLTEAPFSIAPNPEYLFMTERHQEALVHLFHSIESDAGFVLLTGGVGTGKTTVCRSFLDQLPKDTNAAFILNPFLSGKELLRVICQELDIKNVPEKATLRESTDAIYRYLLNNHAQGKQTVLLIDEAQHLHFKVLELIRLLTNLETDTQKLLKIILVGQPELNDTLDKPELTQLSQRITARYHINPLNFTETLSYIDYRLRMAGYLSEKKLFSKHIAKKIYTITQGIPRLINVICDRALLGTYVQNRAVVDRKILAKAIQEVRGKHRLKWHHLFIKRSAIAVAFIAGLLLLSQMLPLILTPFANDETVQVSSVDVQGSITSGPVSTITPIIPIATAPITPIATAPITSIPSTEIKHKHPFTSLKNKEVPSVLNPTIKAHRGIEQEDEGKAIATDFYSHPEEALATLIPVVKKGWFSSQKNCFTIEADGWQCRVMESSDWVAVREYNRPAVVSITGDLGEIYYAPLIGLTESHAQLLGAKGKVIMPLSELSQRWGGGFTYLWQPPNGFKNYIFFGSDAPLVDWLANGFAVIDNRDETLAQKSFNSLLKQRVILFQKDNNLEPDGIAGVRTILKLNERLGIAVTLSADFFTSLNHSPNHSLIN